MKKKILSMILCCLLCVCVTTGLVVFADDNQADITVKFHYDPSLTDISDAKDLPQDLEINLSANENSFTADFVLQNIVGYTPAAVRTTEATGGNLESNANNVSIKTSGASSILSFENLDVSAGEPLTFHVYYTAVEVSYRVKYFFQNANNDDYTEIGALAKAGRANTGTAFSDIELAAMINDDITLWPEGYTLDDSSAFKLLHSIPDRVAADGSTVFQVYFDRKYYSIDFDLGGGYGVEPIYTRYGANVSVGTPVRPGYDFNGWTITVGDADSYSNIPSTMPATNLKYQAEWVSSEQVKYTVAYWATDGDGTTYLLGSKIVMTDPGTSVSGSDDLNADYVCGLEETTHTHDVSCLSADHIHSLACFNLSEGADTNNPNEKDIEAFEKLGTGIENGYAYVIRTDGNSNTWWTRVRINDNWYSPGGANNKSYIADPDNPIDQDETGDYNAYKYKIFTPNCETSCGIEAHTHSDAECMLSDGHLEFVDADQNVVVNGDGTTVVNVYYTHRNYTLRFYYARSYTGTDGNPVYQVVGGSTWYFGYPQNNASVTFSGNYIEDSLEKVTEWGNVSQPIVDADYLSKQNENGDKYFSTGNVSYTNNDSIIYTYHYFEFTASFGSDITDLWPVDMFNTVIIKDEHTGHGTGSNAGQDDLCKYGNYAYFSAWNGEDRVKYTQDHANPTIKGKYTILDDNLIFNTAYQDKQIQYTDAYGREAYLVSYLCFWENGTDTSWSIPKEFVYHIRVQSEDGNIEYNGKKYSEIQLFSVYDNSDYTDLDNQTKMSIKGYECVYVSSEDVTEANALIKRFNFYFYYDIITDQTIKFKNEGEVVKEVTGEPYGKKLVDCLEGFDYNNPPYPTTLEANAYDFIGWCTSYPCSEDTLLTADELASYTIPEGDAVLYAYSHR